MTPAGKPTPGPWTAEPSREWGWVVRAPKVQVQKMTGGTMPKYVASHLTQVDATLIAAAPDLLDLIRAANDFWFDSPKTMGTATAHGGKAELTQEWHDRVQKILDSLVAPDSPGGKR